MSYKLTQIEIKNIGPHENTVYKVRQNKTTLIVGDNQDNASQKSNGSGKSYLGPEALSLCLCGSSVRPIRKDEIVRDGCKAGSVKVYMKNDQKQRELVIARNFYPKAPQECFVWLNNESVDLDSVDSYNKWILEELGLSQDDLYDFYLITKEYYQPFLSITDSKKKAIVNRFSKANAVDQVEAPIKADIAVVDAELTKLNNSLISQKARLEVYNEELQLKREEHSDHKRNEQIELVQTKLANKKRELEEAEAAVLEYDPFIEEKKTTGESYGSRKIKLEEELQELQLTLEPFEAQIKAVDEKRMVLTQRSTQIRTESKEQAAVLSGEADILTAEYKELNKQKSHLESHVAGIIECPSCSHEFVLADKSFDVKKARKDIAALQKKMDAIEKKIDKVEEKEELLKSDTTAKLKAVSDEDLVLSQERTAILSEQRGAQEKCSAVQKAIVELDKAVALNQSAITKLLAEQEKSVLELDKYDAEIEQIKSELKTIKESAFDFTPYEQKIADLEEAIVDTQASIEVKTREKADIEIWLYHFKAFKSYLANQSIKNIQDYTNLHLQQIGSDLQIEIDGYKVTTKKTLKEEITVTVLRDGFPIGSHGRFSAGERSRVDVCVILAIQELINNNAPNGGGLDLVLMDEVIDSIDSFGIECIVKGLQCTQKTIQLISQHHLNSLDAETVVVQKKGGVANLLKVAANV